MAKDSSDAPRAHHTPQLDNLRKQAKRLLQSARDNDTDAIRQLRSLVPRLHDVAIEDIAATAQLADAQHAIALGMGAASWPRLKQILERSEPALYFMTKFREAILAHDEKNARRIIEESLNVVGLFALQRRFTAATRTGNNATATQLLREHPEISAGLPLMLAVCLGNSDVVDEWTGMTRYLAGTSSRATVGVHDNASAVASKADQPVQAEGAGSALLLCAASPFFRDSAERAGGIVRCAELLLDNGADPNSHTIWEEGETRSRITALYHASVMGNTDMMKLLLDRGANPNDGESVPHAAELNRQDSLAVLLAYGANLSDRLPVFNTTTLYFLATQLWDTDRYDNLIGGLRWLLEHGADPNVTTLPSGETPLHAAAQSARGIEAVTLLLDHGAAVDARSSSGRTAWAIALRNGLVEVCEVLRQRGADVGSVSPTDRLIGAAIRCNEEEARAILREHRDLLAQFTDEDRGMFASSVFRGNGESLRTMARLGFDLSWENDWGGTALHLAAWFAKVEMVRELIALGAPVNLRDSKYGSSPLAWAAHGSVNCRSADDEYIAVIEMLIAAGARPEDALNKWNEKASTLASRKVARVLRAAGF